ncbi:hypothetical protein KTQ42_22895 [Noviherbaspirillum sp. L7-7A]|nr:hypothetical protein [Noviherbaspirillum sp. L7-7A]
MTAPDLKRWLDLWHDEGRPVMMMDTRNAFEVNVGTFNDTLDYRIEKFSNFPDVVARHREELAGKIVVTFCTRCVRCEKAAIHMQNIGYDHVYQLEGGILMYFKEVCVDHYTRDRVVFNRRTALNPKLEATPTLQCYASRAVIGPREQMPLLYV